MAYDAASAYEAPSRAYMTRRHDLSAGPHYDGLNRTDWPSERTEYRAHNRPDDRQPSPAGWQQYQASNGNDSWAGRLDTRPQASRAEARQYDPRYQQRSIPAPAFQQNHRPQQTQQRGQAPPMRDTRQMPQRGNERNGPVDYKRSEHQNTGGFNARSDHNAMSEWKAREKAKFQQDATSPKEIPFDNAFPVFGKQKQSKSGPNDLDPINTKPPEEHRRPPHHTVQDQYAPAHIRDRQAVRADHPVSPRPWPAEDPLSSSAEFRSGQWPIAEGSTAAPSTRQDMLSGSAVNDQAFMAHSSPASPRYLPPRQPNQPASLLRDFERVNPDAPSSLLPIRPSTSQGRYDGPGSYADLPPQYAQLRSVSDKSGEQNESHLAQGHARHGSLDDIYTDYASYDDRMAVPSQAPRTRAAEIEAEMPNFDSAAPGQTARRGEGTPASQPTLFRTQTAPPSGPPAGWTSGHQGSQHTAPGSFNMRRNQPQTGDAWNAQAQPTGRVNYEQQAQMNDVERYEYQGLASNRQPRSASQEMPRQDMGCEYFPNYDAASPSTFNTMYGPGGAPLRPVDTAMAPPGNPNSRPRQINAQVLSDRARSKTPSTPRSNALAQNAVPQDQRNGNASLHQARDQDSRPRMRENPMSTHQGEPRPSSHADSLPRHPVPIRAGHMPQPLPSQSVSNTRAVPPSRQPDLQHGQPSTGARPTDRPVTHDELARLRADVDSTKSRKQELILIKRLVEAAYVLANEDGRVDAKTAARNRERFVDEAYKRLKQIVAAGYPDAQFYMADCYGQGTMGLEIDTKEAFKLYQAAAKAGHPQAAYRTAVCCEMGPEAGGGTSKDFPKAVQWYRRAATLGDPAAMYKIGVVLLKGLLGQPKNVVEAVNWLKRGAEKSDEDNPHALHELALLYETSNTNSEVRNKVVPDDSYARELFQKAAKLGYKFSQFRLGQAYEYGNLGLPVDNRSSIAWYSKAAAQGEHQAELALSGWYLTGSEGILENSDMEAYLWARKAASSEPPLAKAMFAMGYFTENGIGCPASLDEARKWYGRAASYKFPKAVERLEELKKGGNKTGTKGAVKASNAGGKLTRRERVP